MAKRARSADDASSSVASQKRARGADEPAVQDVLLPDVQDRIVRELAPRDFRRGTPLIGMPPLRPRTVEEIRNLSNLYRSYVERDFGTTPFGTPDIAGQRLLQWPRTDDDIKIALAEQGLEADEGLRNYWANVYATLNHIKTLEMMLLSGVAFRLTIEPDRPGAPWTATDEDDWLNTFAIADPLGQGDVMPVVHLGFDSLAPADRVDISKLTAPALANPSTADRQNWRFARESQQINSSPPLYGIHPPAQPPPFSWSTQGRLSPTTVFKVELRTWDGPTNGPGTDIVVAQGTFSGGAARPLRVVLRGVADDMPVVEIEFRHEPTGADADVEYVYLPEDSIDALKFNFMHHIILQRVDVERLSRNMDSAYVADVAERAERIAGPAAAAAARARPIGRPHLVEQGTVRVLRMFGTFLGGPETARERLFEATIDVDDMRKLKRYPQKETRLARPVEIARMDGVLHRTRWLGCLLRYLIRRDEDAAVYERVYTPAMDYSPMGDYPDEEDGQPRLRTRNEYELSDVFTVQIMNMLRAQPLLTLPRTLFEAKHY